MKNIKHISAGVVSFLCALSMTVTVFADNTVEKFTVTEATTPVLNPHKGWVQYSYSPWYYESEEYGEKNNSSWSLTDTIYCRFYWSNIETAEGEYDWSSVDDMIKQCEESGRKFAFGIIPSDSGNGLETSLVPQYVYDNGCAFTECPITKEDGTEAFQKTPVWSDEKYIEAALSFAKAIAQRYDGNETIEFIDVRSLGNWGEWHTFGLEGSEMPDEQTQKYVLDSWAEYFDKTTLVLPVNYSEPTEIGRYAADIGITLRRDGLLGFEDSELALSPAFEKGLPCVGEFAYGYETMKPENLWSEDALINAIRNGHITYMAMGKDVPDGLVMYNENKELIEKVQNILGYNLVVDSAELTTDNDKCTLGFTVSNTGSAAPTFDMYFKAAVTDENGSVINNIPNTVKVEHSTLEAAATQSYTIEFDKNLVEEGNCISLGIFENETDTEPTVRFANNNTLENNYLLLGEKEADSSSENPHSTPDSSSKPDTSDLSSDSQKPSESTQNPDTGLSDFAAIALLLTSGTYVVIKKKKK